jgi:2-isopropylmalate synthase
VTVGEDALGEAHLEAQYDGKRITGRAVSTDIIEASALAFLQVLNRIALKQEVNGRIHSTDAPPKPAPIAAAG